MGVHGLPIRPVNRCKLTLTSVLPEWQPLTATASAYTRALADPVQCARRSVLPVRFALTLSMV